MAASVTRLHSPHLYCVDEGKKRSTDLIFSEFVFGFHIISYSKILPHPSPDATHKTLIYLLLKEITGTCLYFVIFLQTLDKEVNAFTLKAAGLKTKQNFFLKKSTCIQNISHFCQYKKKKSKSKINRTHQHSQAMPFYQAYVLYVTPNIRTTIHHVYYSASSITIFFYIKSLKLIYICIRFRHNTAVYYVSAFHWW